jgi:hypothetical protein
LCDSLLGIHTEKKIVDFPIFLLFDTFWCPHIFNVNTLTFFDTLNLRRDILFCSISHDVDTYVYIMFIYTAIFDFIFMFMFTFMLIFCEHEHGRGGFSHINIHQVSSFRSESLRRALCRVK